MDPVEPDTNSPTDEETGETQTGLLNRLPLPVAIIQNGTVAFANQAVVDLLGYESFEAFHGVDMFTHVVKSERSRVLTYLAAHLTGSPDAPWNYTTILTRIDGEQFPAEILTSTIEYNGQHGLLVTAQDLTDRESAERSIWRSGELYRRLVELSPNAITVTDIQGNLLVSNTQAAKMHGFETPEELMASEMNAFELIVPEDRERAAANAARVMAGETLRDLEYKLIRLDGTVFPAEMSVSLLPDAEGNPEAWIGVVRDITERKQIEQQRLDMQAQIQHAQKLESLGVLAGGIAHDFNNLLMGILGNAGLALLDLPAESPTRTHLERIETATQRAAELTQQMLAYSGKGKFLTISLHLDRLVEEIAHLIQTAVSKKISIQYRFAAGLPPVRGDATQLRQVVMNLITNASEAIGAHVGVITVESGLEEVDPKSLDPAYRSEGIQAGRFVRLSVDDTGAGMDEQTRTRLFDPFFTTKFTGRGLGLAAVLGIIRGHGGAIKVESQLKQGTTFTILLPVDHENEKPATDEESDLQQDYQSEGGMILLVDDEPGVRETGASILEHYGFDVLLAVDGQQAIDLLQANKAIIVAVVLDLTMPTMDGREAFAKIRTIAPDLPVILSSGYSEQEAVSSFQASEPMEFLQKPYTPKMLMAKLQRLLGQ